jgi:CRISPR/Cas system CSM-associated protein Csm3 (group 7 of RAMP superfamily)
MESTEETVIGKTIVKGKLKLLSPLLLGSGNDDLADIEVMKDSNGIPFIPGTSLAGVLKHYFEDNFQDQECYDSECFWGIHRKKRGNGKNEGSYLSAFVCHERDCRYRRLCSFCEESCQSAFICHDLFPNDASVRIRDGVKIDPRSQTAEESGKYDFELIEEGAEFDLFWELTLRGNDSKEKHQKMKEKYQRILATLIDVLKNGELSIGAKTNSGFGKCNLEDIHVIHFDFEKKNDVLEWLKQEWQKPDYKGEGSKWKIEPYPKENRTFSIDAKFAIKNSIIIRAYSEKADMPDSTSLTSSGEEYILPGTSLKGAIRHRALKILKTLNPQGNTAEDRIDCLFGIAGKKLESPEKRKNEKSEKEIKSRVQVAETKITNVEPELQTRIKIDRFTGGTVKSALFESMPLWSKSNDEAINVKIKIEKYKEWEACLMMQVLKDLWCGDLAIGGEKNVGRGVLQGLSATIKWEDRELSIEEKEGNLIFSNKAAVEELNRFAECIKQELKA